MILLFRGKLVPGIGIWLARRKFFFRPENPKRLLACESRFAHRVPSGLVLSPETIDVLLRRHKLGMCIDKGQIQKKWLALLARFLDVANAVIDKQIGGIPLTLANFWRVDGIVFPVDIDLLVDWNI